MRWITGLVLALAVVVGCSKAPEGRTRKALRITGAVLEQLHAPPTLVVGTIAQTSLGSGLMKDVGPMSFTYDKRDRLVTAGPSTTTPYTYVFPNDSATPGTYLAVNDRPTYSLDATGRRAYAFGYDNGSNMSAISKYNATGNTITSTTCLVHDALGRLTAVGPAKVLAGPDARACGSESDIDLLSPIVTVRFRYDARNRRVGRQDGAGPWKQYVFTPAGVLLAELTKPTTGGGAWTLDREYVWLDGRPLAQIEYPGPTGGNEGYVYLAGAVFGAFYGGLAAAITGGDVFAGAGAGLMTGLVFGAIFDPSTALFSAGAIMAIQMGGGAVSSFAGSVVGQAVQKGRVDYINWGGVAGATVAGVAGVAGGAWERAVGVAFARGAFPVGEWGIQFSAKVNAGEVAMLGEMLGEAFANLDVKPWQESGTRGDWLRAAGCK